MLSRPTLRFLLRPLSLLGSPSADGGDPFTYRHLEALGRRRLVVEVRDDDTRQRPTDRALDRAKVPFFLGRHERKRITGRVCARGATDAMDVVVRDIRDVEVHDVTELFDVDAPSHDVCGDQYLVLTALEAVEGERAL